MLNIITQILLERQKLHKNLYILKIESKLYSPGKIIIMYKTQKIIPKYILPSLSEYLVNYANSILINAFPRLNTLKIF